MSLNEVTSSERIHIGFFGLRNAGKSSLVNAVTGQELSLVSDFAGTTTDPVKKAMELLPLGPVVIVDTPGIDDEGELGEMRVKRTRQALSYVNIAVLVTDREKPSLLENELIALFKERDIPYIIAHNKADLLEETPDCPDNEIYVSAKDKQNIYELKEMIGRLSKDCTEEKVIVSDLLEKGETAVLVIPIDAAAPKGRLILPQQQTIRDILEKGGLVTVCRDTELKQALSSLSEKPKIVITDSQAFGRVSRDTPEDILLTSFSILFARYKGDLEEAVRGAARLKDLKDGDKVLISEGCTHHRQCGDIGTVKLPKWVREYTGKNIEFSFTSGGEFPDNPSEYALVIHCGGCMLNEMEMKSRISRCKAAGVPVTNYGIAIAELHGILKRSLSPFPDIMKILD